MIWFVLLSAVWNLFIGLVMETEKIINFIVFRLIPFTAGVMSLIYVLNKMGII